MDLDELAHTGGNADEKAEDHIDDKLDGSDDEELPETEKEGTETDVSNDGGVMRKIIKAGKGWETPESGADVSVHYVGTLLSGEKFDSSRDRGEPFNFKLGQGSVIKGWDLGVAKMKKGEISILTCKPEYAYGAAGSPPKIPADATLQFEVELLSWTSDKDISKFGKDKVKPALTKKTTKEGANSWDHPKYGAKIVFSAKPTSGSGETYDNKEVIVGEYHLPKVIERGVKNLSEGETAIITAKGGSRYVEGEDDASWEMTLHSMEKTKEPWSMSSAEKLQRAEAMKEEGNTAFKAGQLKLAAKKYKHGIKFVESDYNISDEEKKQFHEAVGIIAGNAAAVALAQKDWVEAKKHATTALKKAPSNAKAYMRRGKAENETGDWEAALKDLDHGLSLAQAAGDKATETAIQGERAKALAKQKAYQAKEKKAFGGMWAKLQKMEADEAAAAPPAPTPAPAPAAGAEEKHAAAEEKPDADATPAEEGLTDG